MNRLELRERFNLAKINPNSYSFEEDHLSESYCLLKDDLGWKVVYRERGEVSHQRWFELECQHVPRVLSVFRRNALFRKNVRELEEF